jgi:retron-type reverse transcriptase
VGSGRGYQVHRSFDNIQHGVLLKLLAERVADRHILDLVERFLKAGVMEGGLFKPTELYAWHTKIWILSHHEG